MTGNSANKQARLDRLVQLLDTETSDAIRELIETFAPLADDDPNAYSTPLAASLLMLATALHHAGRDDAAADAAGQGVRILEKLATETAPGRFRPELLDAMQVYREALERIGETDAAWQVTGEALALILQLDPDELAAHGPLARDAVRHYRRLGRELGRPADEDLLDRVLARLLAAGHMGPDEIDDEIDPDAS